MKSRDASSSIRGTILVLIIGLLALAPAVGAATGGSVRPSKVMRPTGFGVTPPLRSVTPLAPAVGAEDREVPNKEATVFPVLPGAEASGTAPEMAAPVVVSDILAPAPIVAFDGLDSDTNASVLGYRIAPPDTQGAVGQDYFVQWVNLVWAVYSKDDGSMVAGPFPGNQIWAEALPGSPCASHNDGDPITIYDHGAQRWFMSQFVTDGGSGADDYLCFAVSQSPDPTGAWYAWEYLYGQKMPDYPKVGVWPDGYYISVNEFDWGGAGSPAILVMEREAMLAGNPEPLSVKFEVGNIQPAFQQIGNWDGGAAPPAGTPNYTLSFYDDYWGNPSDFLTVSEIHVDWNDPASSIFIWTLDFDLADYGLMFDSNLCGYNRSCIPQAGTVEKLDALSDRLMYPVNYRNLMDTLGYEVMVVTHNVDVDDTDHAGVRWYELRNYNDGAGWVLHGGGTFAPDSDHRWMGSASVDNEGNIGLIYSISGSTTYPSVGYTTVLSDGTVTGEAVLAAGGGFQSGANRWGDYATVHMDPDGCTFWGTAEYVQTTGNYQWDTAVGAFSVESCTPTGMGTLAGTVTDFATGNPVAGVAIRAGGYITYTASDGTYSLDLPDAYYDVTVSSFGYFPKDFPGLKIDAGQTFTLDVVLEAMVPAIIDGYVTDEIHGWPLYASIEVYSGGREITKVFTNPFNGYYQVELPSGLDYTLEVESLMGSYAPMMRDVQLVASTTESFVMTLDGEVPWATCLYANGIPPVDFESGFPPQGWSTVDLNGGSYVWIRTDQVPDGGLDNATPGQNGLAAVAYANGSGAWNSALVSPIIMLPDSPALGLQFDSNFQDAVGNGDAWVEITTDGVNWTPLWWKTIDEPNSSWTGYGQTHHIDLSAWAGQSVQIRWRYTCEAGYSIWWQVDDIMTYTLPITTTPLITQDFDWWPLGGGWTIVNNGGDCVWEDNEMVGYPYGQRNFTGGEGHCADADAQRCGRGTSLDTELHSPVLDFSGETSVWVEFKYFYNDYPYSTADGGTFDYSIDGGTTWTNVITWGGADDGPGFFLQDMSAELAGQSQVVFRWTYTAPYYAWAYRGYYLQVDEFRAYGEEPVVQDPPPAPAPAFECFPVPGALMAGYVTDANTGVGVLNASIMDDQGNATTSMATPEDPALGDGFYWLFTNLPLAEGPSTRTFTVQAADYATLQVQVNPVPEAVNRLDFPLGAGALQITPNHLEAYLFSGETESQALDFLNDGAADANVRLLAFQQNGWVPNMPMDNPERSAPAGHENDRTARASGPSGATPQGTLAAGDVINSWPIGLTAAWGIAIDQHTGRPWIGEGWGNDTIYEFTPDGTRTGRSWVANWGPLHGPADYTFDYTRGMIWVLDVGSDNCLHELDPRSGYTGDTICWGTPIAERGVAHDPYTDTFFVGSWGSKAITRFDRNGTVLQRAYVGLNISGLAYNPNTGHLFVMVNDEEPNPVWVLDVNNGYAIIGSFVVPGINAWDGAGLGISCDGHLWAVNQSDQIVFEVDSGETDACPSGTLPWFQATPDAGVVPAGGTLPITGTFMADGAPHWGLVQGRIVVAHDTPNTVDDVSLCLTRAFDDVPETHWASAFVGALAGARISSGCGASTFCPDDVMTRGVMAAWLIRAMHGPDYPLGACTGIFADVVCDVTPNAASIEALYNEGVTAGCNTDPLMYCPDSPVTRAQMAVFLLAAREGTGYTPPACTGIFNDVPCPTHWAADWVEELSNRGVTAGCGGGNYCPNDNTTRSQMSVFMTVNWDLPMCDTGQ